MINKKALKLLQEKYTTLYLGSGGLKGLAYIGCLKSFEDYNILKNINKIYGCSIGSLFGLLIILGYSSYELILEFQRDLDIRKYQDINADTVLNFTRSFGLDTGKKLEEMIKEHIRNKNCSPYITLNEFYKKYNIDFNILTTNITTGKPVIMNYKSHPDIPVWMAVRISCSLPGVFVPIKYKGDLYVDGGVNETNIKHSLIENEKEKVIPITFLCDKNLDNIVGFVVSLLNAFQFCYENEEKCNNNDFIILKPTGIIFYQKYIPMSCIKKNIDYGYEILDNYLKNQLDKFTKICENEKTQSSSDNK